MSMDAKQWLDDWRNSNIYAEARWLEAVDETVDEIFEDALHEKYTKESIVAAAGGNLRKYVYDAIALTSGELDP